MYAQKRALTTPVPVVPLMTAVADTAIAVHWKRLPGLITGEFASILASIMPVVRKGVRLLRLRNPAREIIPMFICILLPSRPLPANSGIILFQ